MSLPGVEGELGPGVALLSAELKLSSEAPRCSSSAFAPLSPVRGGATGVGEVGKGGGGGGSKSERRDALQPTDSPGPFTVSGRQTP